MNVFIDVVTQPKETSQITILLGSLRGAERGDLMLERCKQCERCEKGLKELRERRTNLWRRRELTDAAAEKLAAEEQQITGELKKHQATQHGHSPAKTLATEPSQNLEAEIRRRAYELYEARGREDGHEQEDWLRAEAEVKGTVPKTTAA
jgi:hypothetical protein